MQKKTSLVRDIIVVGFALFSMFFGAGNVIFPPYLGLESGSQWVSGFATYFTRSGIDVRHYPVRGSHGGHPPHLRHYL